jgi:hypothetical protein
MLPEAVEKQARLAEELHRQAYGNPSEQGAANVEQGNTATSEGVQDQSAQQQQEQLQQQQAPVEDAAYWKNRFDVLEGKYRAEVPRYAEQVRTLQSQVGELQRKLEDAAKVVQPAATPDDLLQKYGDEFVQDIRRLVPQQDDALRSKVETIERLTVEQLKDRFYGELDKAAPNWRVLNEDKDFLTWLSGIDSLSGQPRMILFDDAADKNDAARVANFFNNYSQPSQSKERQTSTKPDLSREVVPETGRMTPPSPAAKKLWSQAEITRFYEDVRKGLINKDDAANIERDIFAAQREGRIR